ncbi:type VII secretion protein EccCa [Streptacidiphilus sp. EB129]|uniref:type VII secretion protein EccCa n=1 Tax=Streptacidiphilus sp. EB129 TaxID=3156262 RepID=UPI00351873D3
MTTVVFRRPPRQKVPPMPRGELTLQEPPVLPEAGRGGLGQSLMMLPMAAGSGASMLFFAQPGSNHTMSYLSAGMMAMSSVGMAAGSIGRSGGDRKHKLRGERRDYMRYLGQMRRQVRELIVQQHESLRWNHPAPESLWSVAMSRRLWERRTNHPDFCEVRIGTGPQRLGTRLTPPQTKPVEDLEPLCAGALRRFLSSYTTVPEVPIPVYLRAFGRVLFDGDEAVSRGMVRSVLAELATFHSPDDLRIAVCTSPEREADWEWVKWLPHAQHPSERDASGNVRLVAGSFSELEELLGGEEFRERPRFDPKPSANPGEPYVVVVLDGVRIPDGSQAAVAGFRNTVLLDVGGCLPFKAARTALRLRTSAAKVELVGEERTGKDTFSTICVPGTLSVVRCTALAQTIAPFRLGVTAEATQALATDIELTALLGVGDARALDPAVTWKARSTWDQLRVPIGIAEDGTPVELDIKEAARGGMGPHGMLIGATGSGKSELLRTLVLALAVTHSSEVLNFVLVDFKGGATFLGLDDLPHTSAVITNLADELPLVDRMHDAITSEMNRRQELLRRAGNFSSIHDYEKARAAGAQLAPLPTLYLVVDEFSELLATKREFIDLFVMIGRLGRSLGIHLLLASQRVDEGRMHVLESHLSYRIGLRTFSAGESRSVLGVADAYELPSAPGNGYLKTGTSNLTRFKAAYVSGPYQQTEPVRRAAVIQQQIVPYSVGFLAPPAEQPETEEEAREREELEAAREESGETLMEVLIDRLRDQGPPPHQVWLPPLSAPPLLDEILPPLSDDAEYGLQCADAPSRGRLTVPLGVVDRPADQRRDLLMADLSGGAGHVGVAGASQSGKSTLLRTLILSLSLLHTPREAQFYCLDFGGGTLSSLRGLPHVGGVASRMEPEKVTRTIAEMVGLLASREELFRRHEVESMAAYRELRRAGGFAEDPYGDVFLVIDGWFTLHQDYESLEGAIQELAARGLTYGIHLVVSGVRWTEIRPWLRDQLGTKFELRLPDHIDSEVSPRLAALVPEVPGRGITRDSMHFLGALPRIDGKPTSEGLAEAVRDLVDEIATAWTGAGAPAVRLLPTLLPVDRLPPADGDLRVPIGLDEIQLHTVWHDFEQHPHLMVFGDTETGKTNLLRLVAHAVAGRYNPDQARVMLADTRRDLHDVVPAEHQLGYAVSSGALSTNIKEALSILRGRVPGPDIDPSRLRLRDWWIGPILYVLVDDYDLLSSPMDSPLAPLMDLLAQGNEIGLHLVVARSSAGAGRSMGDPVMRRLWDLGTPGLMLSTPREEGPFLGSAMPKKLPVGRAQLVTRRGAVLVQTPVADRA